MDALFSGTCPGLELTEEKVVMGSPRRQIEPQGVRLESEARVGSVAKRSVGSEADAEAEAILSSNRRLESVWVPQTCRGRRICRAAPRKKEDRDSTTQGHRRQDLGRGSRELDPRA